MTQTYRTNDGARWGTGQGFNLTPAQVDINFWDIIQRVVVLEAAPDAAAGIDHFEIIGRMMYVHMTDATVLGPYELPVAIYNDRGIWTPSTVYAVLDTFQINGGLYAVIFAHTSDTSFDPAENDGSGHDYYQLMLQTPGSSLPSGGAVGRLLQKSTALDYEVMWGFTDASVVTFEPSTGSTLGSFNVADALEELAAAGAGGGDAVDIVYDPTASGLAATNVQDAIDEVAAAAGGGGIGRQTIWVPASAMIPRTSNGPASGTLEMTTNKNMVRTLDFDTSTAEFAQFDIAMPQSWDEGDIFFKVFWSHASTTTNFGVAFQLDAWAMENADALDSVFVGPQLITDTGGTTNTLYISPESPAVFSGGEAGNLIAFRISRAPANAGDNLAVDARLHGVQIIYLTSAATDD